MDDSNYEEKGRLQLRRKRTTPTTKKKDSNDEINTTPTTRTQEKRPVNPKNKNTSVSTRNKQERKTYKISGMNDSNYTINGRLQLRRKRTTPTTKENGRLYENHEKSTKKKLILVRTLYKIQK
jgi:hypothetical protein